MKFKNTVVAVALCSVFGAAFANTSVVVDLGMDPTGTSYDRRDLIAGAFSDTFDFGISDPSTSTTSSSFTIVKSSKANFDISGFLTSLYSKANPSVKLLADSIDGTSTNYSVGAGSYFYVVTGNVIGNRVGGYNLAIDTYKAPSIPSPVPEPETYAMMLAGLGLLGFAARRKAKANQG